MGVWIETSLEIGKAITPKGHTLRGCVDWNLRCVIMYNDINVTPFVGVWIETVNQQHKMNDKQSHPSWVCGLKLTSK